MSNSLRRQGKSLSELRSIENYQPLEDVKKELRSFQWQNHRRFLKLGLTRYKHGPKCGCGSCEPFRRFQEHSIPHSCPGFNSPWFDSWCDYSRGELRDFLENEQGVKEPETKKHRQT